jgi:serine/threonine protein kinase
VDDHPPLEQLRRWHLGLLLGEEAEVVSTHVNTCTACAARLDEMSPFESAPNATGDASAGQPPSWVGQTVLGYRVLEVIGRGGLGVVYRAADPNLPQQVALKTVFTASLWQLAAMIRFRNDAKALVRLRHPNIISVYQYGEHQGHPVIVMEYADGGSLDAYTAREPCSPREAAAVVEVLAQAVHYAHGRGIIHRDLSPGNILLVPAPATPPGGPSRALSLSAMLKGRAWVPKIADFNLVKFTEEDGGEGGVTLPREALGTPSYMAPEQARGDLAAIDVRTDVYGLGGILYRLLTGKPPFSGQSRQETLRFVEERPPESPRLHNGKVPNDLETICLSCLAKEPVKRYASAAALADDLRRFLNGEPIRARPVSSAERFRSWCRRNPGRAAVAVVTFLAAVALLTVYVLQERRIAEEARFALAAETEGRRVAEEALTREVVAAGDTAARLGAQTEARDKYQEAIGRPGLSDGSRALLRVRIVRASMTLDDMEVVKASLDALGRESLPEEAAATYRFEKALYLLQRSMEVSTSSLEALTAETNPFEKEAEELLRQSAEDRTLPAADRLTARGLLAQSADGALDRFREAMAQEPFHPYANPYFASTALFAGRLEEALAVLEVWTRVSPRASSPVLHKAFALTLLGRHDEADRALGALAPAAGGMKVGPDTLAAYRFVIRTAREINRSLVEKGGGDFALVQLMELLNTVPVKAQAGGPGVFRVPLTPAQRRSVYRFALAVVAARLSFNARSGLQKLGDTQGFVADGVRLYFRGCCYVDLQDWAAAAEELTQAAGAPQLFDTRRVCLLGAANCKLKQAARGTERDRFLAEARDLVHRAYGLGPMDLGLKEKYLEFLIQSEDLTFAGDRARAWGNQKALERIEQLRRSRP